MRAYASLKNIEFNYSVDGIGFEMPDGTSIFLDFDEHDYFKPSEYKSCFRLKSACVSIDGEESVMSDNDIELFEMLKKSKLEEVIIYSHNVKFERYGKVKVQTLKIETPNGELFFKTNKCKVR